VWLTPLGETFRRGVEPASIALTATLDECRRLARGDISRLKIGFLGGGLYELTLPVVTEFRKTFPDIDLEWVELNYVDQSQSVLDGKVDAAFCRLPLGQAGLVQGPVLLRDKRMLVVPTTHRLAGTTLADAEELAQERIPVMPTESPVDAWREFHFPRRTPKGQPILDGPVVRTVRESIAAVEAGQAVMLMTGRAENYYSNPNVKFVEIDLPPIYTAFVRRRDDTRPGVLGLEQVALDVARRYAGEPMQDGHEDESADPHEP
jgi:DNA-binding transcriptional LysR family regulator